MLNISNFGLFSENSKVRLFNNTNLCLSCIEPDIDILIYEKNLNLINKSVKGIIKYIVNDCFLINNYFTTTSNQILYDENFNLILIKNLKVGMYIKYIDENNKIINKKIECIDEFNNINEIFYGLILDEYYSFFIDNFMVINSIKIEDKC